MYVCMHTSKHTHVYASRISLSATSRKSFMSSEILSIVM